MKIFRKKYVNNESKSTDVSTIADSKSVLHNGVPLSVILKRINASINFIFSYNKISKYQFADTADFDMHDLYLLINGNVAIISGIVRLKNKESFGVTSQTYRCPVPRPCKSNISYTYSTSVPLWNKASGTTGCVVKFEVRGTGHELILHVSRKSTPDDSYIPVNMVFPLFGGAYSK